MRNVCFHTEAKIKATRWPWQVVKCCKSKAKLQLTRPYCYEWRNSDTHSCVTCLKGRPIVTPSRVSFPRCIRKGSSAEKKQQFSTARIRSTKPFSELTHLTSISDPPPTPPRQRVRPDRWKCCRSTHFSRGQKAHSRVSSPLKDHWPRSESNPQSHTQGPITLSIETPERLDASFPMESAPFVKMKLPVLTSRNHTKKSSTWPLICQWPKQDTRSKVRIHAESFLVWFCGMVYLTSKGKVPTLDRPSVVADNNNYSVWMSLYVRASIKRCCLTGFSAMQSVSDNKTLNKYVIEFVLLNQTREISQPFFYSELVS